MSEPGLFSVRAIIVAPTGRDAPIASRILAQAGFPSDPRPNIRALCDDIGQGAGLAIIADEALLGADLEALATFVREQPPWSDFPFIVLTHRDEAPEHDRAVRRLTGLLGNVTFLERPFHPLTLVSLVRSAVSARKRQYDARARLEELREGERSLHTALNAGHLGAWILELPGLQLQAAAECRLHFGRGRSPLTYREFVDAAHPDDRPELIAVIDRASATGEDFALEFRNVWPDGSEHWIDIRARGVKDHTGRVVKLVGLTSDITGRKHSELEREALLAQLANERAALAELTATLERRVDKRTKALLAEVAARERAQEQLLQAQKMESIGQLTGGVAHDFNNLLMAVMGNLELLRKRLPDDPRLQALVEGALQGARRGASLTQRMLAFARQQDLITQSTDIASLLAGMRDLLARTLGPRIVLEFEISDGLPPAIVDANQVELAILNLAINARDAMPEGGSIRISATVGDSASLDREAGQTYLRLAIEDTGFGMAPETLKRAIEPFFSTKPPGKGTGLGLSMVHGLAVQLGGKLILQSEPGCGTTATLYLPVATEPLPVEVTSTGPELPEVRHATILVVDDDPLIATSTVGMLEDLGHTVIEASSGDQALEILDAGEPIDLMMTDHAMPGMSGLELVEHALLRRPSLPILLATGYADLPEGKPSHVPRLSKPYRQADLQAEINRLLRRRAAVPDQTAPAA